MFIVTMLACQANPPTDVAGAVLQTWGAPRVARAGTDTLAVPGALLLPGDVLQTGAGTIIVQLANQHVVRLDEDVELAIEDLALWQAPASTVPATEQLAQLLYEGEALAPDVEERIAGWQGRLSSGTAVNAVERMRVAEQREGSPDVADSEPEAAPAPPQRKSALRKLGQPGSKLVGGRGGASGYGSGVASKSSPPAAELAPSPPPPPAAARVAKPSPKSEERDDRPVVASELGEPETPQTLLDAESACLVGWHAALGIPLDSLHVDLVVREGKVVRVKAARGLTLPPCARDPLLGKTLEPGQATSFDLTF